MEIETKDLIVRRVLRKMDQRSLIGQEKYGATMMEEIEGEVKDLNRFLVDVQEELMDAILYIESCRELMNKADEAIAEQRMNIIGQNGNDGLHYDDMHTSYPGDIEVTYDCVKPENCQEGKNCKCR